MIRKLALATTFVAAILFSFASVQSASAAGPPPGSPTPEPAGIPYAYSQASFAGPSFTNTNMNWQAQIDVTPVNNYTTDSAGDIIFGCEASSLEPSASFNDSFTITVTNNDSSSETNSMQTSDAVEGEVYVSDGAANSTINLLGSLSGSCTSLDDPPAYSANSPTLSQLFTLGGNQSTFISGTATGKANGT